MHRKPHVLILAVVALAACVVGAGCDRLKARDRLNKGVQAYKGGQFDQAIEDFKEAKELDPKLTNAQLYLAAAYTGLYIPGAPSPENIRNGEQAATEYKRSSIAIPITSPPSTASARFSSTWAARPTIRRKSNSPRPTTKSTSSSRPTTPSPTTGWE